MSAGTQSVNDAQLSMNEDAVAGAFGMGMDYFMANEEDRTEIVANATTLERDEWETLTDRMVEVYQRELNGIQHLREANLTRSVSLATRVDLWQEMTEMTEADISMDGENRSEEDRLTYQTEGVPIPIIHKDFRIPQRVLETSRRMNNDLRTDEVAAATRVVSEMAEAVLFQGWSPNVPTERGETFQLYGYTNHPDRNQIVGSNWDTADNIRDDFVAMLDEMDKDNRTGGGFWVYIHPQQWRQFRSAIDPDGDGNQTVRERIRDEFGQEIGRIARAPYLNTGEAVMVDPRQDVVELAEAEDIQTIEWQSGSGMTNHFKVMAAMAPELKSDANGQSGIVHTTGI